jgi:hypothetical protein
LNRYIDERLIPLQGLNEIALRITHFDDHRHLADGMGRAGQAGIVSANGSFNPVEQTFGDFWTVM